MKYDETDLIEFFGVLPSEQEPEEKEFFGTTIFDYYQSRYHLCVSFSIYNNDFYLDLKDVEVAEPMLEIQLERVEEIRVRRDKPTSVPVLIVRTRCNAEEAEKEELMQTMQLSLEPKLGIKINNQNE